jgi:predicted dienelactone hydrolase
MNPRLLAAFGLAVTLLAARPSAFASEVGWRQMVVPGTPELPSIVVALYYPTQQSAREVVMGPFVLHVALQAPPEAKTLGLIVLSHGTGGSEIAHSSLAEALARHGYLVAALRHPGDNWQDRSLLQAPAGRYFAQRPQDMSRVIDALLNDPEWGPRIARDSRGARVGAVGHSAGGYTVTALAGGMPDFSRLAAHCNHEAARDPIFCRVAQSRPPSASSVEFGPMVETRVRAIVALAPLGVVFSARSLSSIRVPFALYIPDEDHFLVPRFHGDWIAANTPRADTHRVPNAGHFAFVDTPVAPVPSDDGDIGADPPGFDRHRFQRELQTELVDFFDAALR